MGIHQNVGRGSNRLTAAASRQSEPIEQNSDSWMKRGLKKHPNNNGFANAPKLASAAMAMFLHSLDKAGINLQKFSTPLQKIYHGLSEEAKEFVKRVEENAEIREGLSEIICEIIPDGKSRMDTLKQFISSLGAHLSNIADNSNDQLGLSFEEQLKTLAERGQVDAQAFLNILKKHPSEFIKEREKIIQEQEARDALEV